jgi:UDP-N-acetylmuramate--alanine ligase
MGEYFVIEADEYKLAFLGLRPEIAVITNIEHDHPDQFETLAAMREAFQAFADQVEKQLILCADDPGAMQLVSPGRERITYGLKQTARWRAEEIRPNGAGGSDFLTLDGSEVLGLVRTRMPGRHNVLNALGALAAADSIGVSFVEAREALAEYHGVARRFQVLGEEAGVVVVDDYAHHPTEIQATLQAARQRYPEHRLVAVFQPHTYSRTKKFLPQLAVAFDLADEVIVTDIYAAREEPEAKMDGQLVADSIDHEQARHIGDFKEASEYLAKGIEEATVVITLSAGDGNQVGKLLLEGLRKRKRGSGYGQEE